LSLYLKPILVLVVSVLVFAGAAYLVDVELLDYVKTHFYNPSIVKSVVRENKIDAELVQNHIYELQNQFALTLNETAIRDSFLYNQNASDIFERSRIFGILLETVSGLQSVQFVDSNGSRIHYSTSARDIINQGGESAAYRNYPEDSRSLPYDLVSVPAYGKAKFIMDEDYERVIFSFPFYDSMDVYRGTALFSVSVRALAEKLIAEGRLKANDDVSVIGLPSGVVFGSPDTSKADILGKVSSVWNDGLQDYMTFDSEGSGVKYALISAKTNQNLYFGRLINDSVFSIPDTMRLILLLSMFLTFYLTLYFLVNFKPHPATLVRNRIKNLRANIFEQLYVNKSSQERTKWILELEQRRDEIRSELKYNLKLRPRQEKNIDTMIDKAWDELLAVIKSGSERPAPIVIKEEVLTDKAEQLKELDKVEKAEELEELDEVEEAEELEELDEVEEAEELEELDEVEEAEELEELDEVEEAEELEELDEVEEAEELEELDEVEEAEELGKVEEAEELEELDEVEEAEELEVLDEVEELEELDEIEEAEDRKGLMVLTNRGGVSHYEPIEPKKYEIPMYLHKNLATAASEIEFNREVYPVNDDDDAEDLHTDLDIVSPFLSMFSSLSEEETDPEET